MKLVRGACRVGVVGASSLLGKELLAVLEEREFPVSRLISFEADEEEPNLPIVDLQEDSRTAIPAEEVQEGDLDIAFLASPAKVGKGNLAFLGPARNGSKFHSMATSGESSGRLGNCTVIDLCAGPTQANLNAIRVPFLDRGHLRGKAGTGTTPEPTYFVSPHSAAILISSLLLRLSAYFQVERAVANVFSPASEMGPRAIEELQKQTVNILSFQKLPQAVFGSQLAFNLLPRLGREPASALTELENRIRSQLREYLTNRAPYPALRVFQTPVFYSLAVSLYIELAGAPSLDALTQAIAGGRVHVRRSSQPAPSQVEATGSEDIILDFICAEPDHPHEVWLWAVADNLRLAAVNAVEIAEGLWKRIGENRVTTQPGSRGTGKSEDPDRKR